MTCKVYTCDLVGANQRNCRAGQCAHETTCNQYWQQMHRIKNNSAQLIIVCLLVAANILLKIPNIFMYIVHAQCHIHF